MNVKLLILTKIQLIEDVDLFLKKSTSPEVRPPSLRIYEEKVMESKFRKSSNFERIDLRDKETDSLQYFNGIKLHPCTLKENYTQRYYGHKKYHWGGTFFVSLFVGVQRVTYLRTVNY